MMLLGGVLLGLVVARVPFGAGTPVASLEDFRAEPRPVHAPPEDIKPESLIESRAPTTAAIRANFGFCHSGGGTNCVVDGDTFWMAGQKIRIADIDTPETHPPRCAEEARLGAAATERLRQLLNGGPITLAAVDRDTDRYGRKLRIVLRDGHSIGDTLVSEGLARPYAGGRRPWCA